MLRFNLTGFLMLGGAALVVALLVVLGVPQRWAGVFALGAIVLFDLALRLTNPAIGREKWLGRTSGGMLAFLPAWLMSLLLGGLVATGLLGE